MTQFRPRVVVEEEPHLNGFVGQLDPSPSLRLQLEDTVLAAVLAGDTEGLPALHPSDFTAGSRPIFDAIKRIVEEGRPLTLPTLALELEMLEALESIGGPQRLGHIADSFHAGGSVALGRELLRVANRERIAGLHASLALHNVPDDERHETLTEILALEAENPGASPVLSKLGFSGSRLERTRLEPEPSSPWPELFDSEPSLIVLNGEPKTGKTSFGLAVAISWAAGTPLWSGSPSLPGTRALVLSAEQPLRRIDHTARRLDAFLESTRERWTERVTLVARHPDLEPGARRMLCLDERGLGALRAAIRAEREAGDPYGFVLVDSLSRCKPPELEENNAGDMSRWLQRLQEMAEDEQVHVALVHHVGHSKRDGAVAASRGSSAIGAVAQTSWRLSRDGPRRRSLLVEGNAVLRREFSLETCGPASQPDEILYFRPFEDPDRSIDELMARGEQLSKVELVRSLTGDPSIEKPTGWQGRRADRLRRDWLAAGLVTQLGRRNWPIVRPEQEEGAGE